jgi:hypothetical protein
MKAFHVRVAGLAAIAASLASTGPAHAQAQMPQTVTVNGSAVLTGRDVAPAGTSYTVFGNIAEAVVAFAQNGTNNVQLLHGPYSGVASGLTSVIVNNAVIRNTFGTCGGCRARGGVGLAQFRPSGAAANNFFLAYPTQDAHIHLRTWTPQTWPTANPPDLDLFSSVDSGAQTTYAPNLVSFGGALVLAFRDDNNNLHVWRSQKGDFSDLSKTDLNGPQSDWAPAIANLAGTLVLGRQQADPGCTLTCKPPALMVSVGPGFSPEVLFTNATMDNSGPGALGFGSTLFFSWRGSGNRNISFTQLSAADLSSALGGFPSQPTPNPVTVLGNGEASEHTPNLASFGDVLNGFKADLIWHDGNTSNTGSEGTNLLVEQVGSIAPATISLCANWKANYVDSMLGDDVLGNTNMPVVPASFAQYSILSGSTQVLNGFLDQKGCLTARGDAQTLTQLALNPDGTPVDPNASFTLRQGSFFTKTIASGSGRTGTIHIIVSSATDFPSLGPGGTPLPASNDTISTPFSITSAAPITITPTKMNEVTGVSAFVSTLLVREETDDLGLQPTTLTVYAEHGCGGVGFCGINGQCSPGDTCDSVTGRCITDCSHDAGACVSLGQHCDTQTGRCVNHDSCASPTLPELYIGPQINVPNNCPPNTTFSQSRWKFVVAHEFGHTVQFAAKANMTVLYNPQIPGRPPICRCDHVTVSNSLHCMQGLQRWDDAQEEGFAHFFSANIWNSKFNPNGTPRTSCVFEYYKEFLVTNPPANLPAGDFRAIQNPPEQSNPPLAGACYGLNSGVTPADGGPGSFFSILPPIKVDCLGVASSTDPTSMANYRLGAPCLLPHTASDLTTEFDWMKFFTNINRNPTNSSVTIGISEILSLYHSFCSNSANTCDEGDAAAPKKGSPTFDDVRGQAQANLSAAKASLFLTFGNTFGVDRNL